MGKADLETGHDGNDQPPVSASNYNQSSIGAPPPPSFEEAINGSKPEDAQVPTSMPPDYFDVSIVPESNVLLRQNIQPMEASTAEIKRELKGVSSMDERLQSNVGSHQETRVVHQTVSDGNGGTRSEARTETRTVVDFSFGLDVTPYVLQDWTAVFALPKGSMRKQRKNVRAVGAHAPDLAAKGGMFREALEEYTLSKNILKE
ncbi:hypothetical protein HDU67_005130 [Dinochytrium kinnereticum]|nr:hypothetical protein HDU67_005130 [Dinochytrium kinnereticum]